MEDWRNEQFDDLLDRAAETLCQEPIPPGPPPEAVAHVLEAIRKSPANRPLSLWERARISSPLSLWERVRVSAFGDRVLPSLARTERTKTMKRISKIAVAATLLIALGMLVSWTVIGGGSTNIAFARVAEALDSLRSATYDVTSESKGDKGQPPATATGKGFFLAPSHQRMEVSVDIGSDPAVKAAAAAARRVHAADSPAAAKAAGQAAAETMAKAVALMPKMKQVMITIADNQTDKAVMLMPNMKLAMSMDMKKMREDIKKSAQGAPPDLFELVRRLVREGSSGTGEKVERFGKKEIDGREAVGFRTVTNMFDRTAGTMCDMILWADPETARPVRIEIGVEIMGAGVHMVMNNFCYDVDLDPSLFSLEPPEGYSTQAMNITMPLEEDLLNTLRTIAEHNKGLFPAKLGMNKEVMESLMAGNRFEMDKVTAEKMEAEMDKIAAKYGGKEKLRAKYGKDIPPAIMAEIMEATMPLAQEQTREQMQKQMPLIQKRTQGITFYAMLKPENDPHYVGGGVKLGTPNRPILWYKPTGAEKYRVIYADLSVKELAADQVKTPPEAKAK